MSVRRLLHFTSGLVVYSLSWQDSCLSTGWKALDCLWLINQFSGCFSSLTWWKGKACTRFTFLTDLGQRWFLQLHGLLSRIMLASIVRLSRMIIFFSNRKKSLITFFKTRWEDIWLYSPLVRSKTIGWWIDWRIFILLFSHAFGTLAQTVSLSSASRHCG